MLYQWNHTAGTRARVKGKELCQLNLSFFEKKEQFSWKPLVIDKNTTYISLVKLDHMANPNYSEVWWGLQNEEEPGEPVQVVGDAPPPYSSISPESAVYFEYKDESGFPKPPSYNVATTLPTYDEAERTKAEATIPLVPGRDEDFVGRDDFDDADQLRIGNDGIFMLTFFMAFLFNWIGFFLSFCLTTSAAGRYGAISGFGLSLIKWILIVRFSTYFPGYFDGQYWLWWVFLVLGFLLFLRGFINYAKVRKMPETFSNLPRTRVLFIY
ncbi:NEDD4 family-interacting protein 1 isoform X1 [Saccopteryx leptura]|uniref:NEDD4 family-interacting protein 1 isoform X1 n=2 Tax=Saccopteryx leptura TaxID=249018 RepID=UPI00339BFF35